LRVPVWLPPTLITGSDVLSGPSNAPYDLILSETPAPTFELLFELRSAYVRMPPPFSRISGLVMLKLPFSDVVATVFCADFCIGRCDDTLSELRMPVYYVVPER